MKKILAFGCAIVLALTNTSCVNISGILGNIKNMMPTVKDCKVTENTEASTITLSYTLTGGFEGGDMQSELVWTFASKENLPDNLKELASLFAGQTKPFCVSAIQKEVYATADDAKEAMNDHSDDRSTLSKRTITTDLTGDYTPTVKSPDNIWSWEEVVDEAKGKKTKLEKTNSLTDIFDY